MQPRMAHRGDRPFHELQRMGTPARKTLGQELKRRLPVIGNLRSEVYLLREIPRLDALLPHDGPAPSNEFAQQFENP